MALKALPADLIEHVVAFLDLHSTASLLNATRSGSGRDPDWVRRRWQRSCSALHHSSWSSSTFPIGAFTLERRDWFQAGLARESIQSQLHANMTPGDQITSIVDAIVHRHDSSHLLEEGMRWIGEIFEQHGEWEAPLAMISPAALHMLVISVQGVADDVICQQLAAKMFGILAMNAPTRQALSDVGIVHVLVQATKAHHDSTELVDNVLWALVILGRGEGARYHRRVHPTMSSYSNSVVTAVVAIIRLNTTSPQILAKAFWAIVNLSLMDGNIATLVEIGAVQLIVTSMMRFKDERDLQLHACLALLNLSSVNAACVMIVSQHGIEAVLAAMEGFDDFPMLQRCACNVLVSLSWDRHANRQRMAMLRAAELVHKAIGTLNGFQPSTTSGRRSCRWNGVAAGRPPRPRV